jgi:hypothetical protein
LPKRSRIPNHVSDGKYEELDEHTIHPIPGLIVNIDIPLFGNKFN